jgi:hypothetical protein
MFFYDIIIKREYYNFLTEKHSVNIYNKLNDTSIEEEVTFYNLDNTYNTYIDFIDLVNSKLSPKLNIPYDNTMIYYNTIKNFVTNGFISKTNLYICLSYLTILEIPQEVILSFVHKYNIKKIIFIEATYLNIFKIALFLKFLKIKIYLIVNVECIRLEELSYHNIFDNILANNIDSYNIINSIFPNKSKLLSFHLNYPYYNEINKNIMNINNRLKFCCFGGLNSISRKNITLIIGIFLI